MELYVKRKKDLTVYLSIRCEPDLKNCGLAAVLRDNEAWYILPFFHTYRFCDTSNKPRAAYRLANAARSWTSDRSASVYAVFGSDLTRLGSTKTHSNLPLSSQNLEPCTCPIAKIHMPGLQLLHLALTIGVVAIRQPPGSMPYGSPQARAQQNDNQWSAIAFPSFAPIDARQTCRRIPPRSFACVLCAAEICSFLHSRRANR